MKSIGNKRFAFYVLHFAFAVLAAHETNAALPSGYTQLDYIASSGTQYIDTGVVPTTTTRVVCDFRLTAMPSAAIRCGWGASSKKEAFWFGTNNTFDKFGASVSGNWTEADTGVPVDTSRHTFDISASAIKFDGTAVANSGTAFTDAASGNTMFLFASRQGWNPAVGAYGSMEIYSCQIYSGDTPVRDFVPARRGSDDAVGLYDTVNDVFYMNDGVGSFIASSASTSTYTAVEYIESDGNQYIDTQFTMGSTHAATLDFQLTVLPSVASSTDPNGTQSLFGCRAGYESKNIVVYANYTDGFGVDFNNGSTTTYRLLANVLNTSSRYAVATAAGVRLVCDKSTGIHTTDADLWSGAAFTCDGTALLFAAKDSATGNPLWNKAKMKFFGGTVVASDGTLLCKFVPCLRNGTEPGVYDPVRALFLPNIGTGSFTYGAATGVVYGGAATSPSAATIDPTNYECSMTITPVAGSVSTTLSNFPLLVRLSAARQIGFNPADCGTNGADLRFALSDGTLLSHEIDTWSTTGESLVWVNVPAFSSATQIVAYWGVKDASVAPSVTASDTWPDFVAVYHLGEGSATARDSSANGYDARNAATVTAGSSPKVGGCALVSNLFTADVTSLTDPTATKPLADRSVVTFSSWVAIDSINTSSSANAQNARLELARKYSTWDSGAGGFSCRYFADNAYTSGSHTAKPLFGIAEPSGNGTKGGTTNWNTIQGADTGTWLYLTCVVDGTNVAKYINGVLATGKDLNDGSNTQNPRNISHSILGPDIAPLQFGAREDGSGGTHAGVMRGRMDEMRIRSGAASADWIAADFAQQNTDTFLSYGPVSGAEAPLFTVDPIAAQTVTSALEFLAGVTPSVTVRDGTTSNLLVEASDYTVAYVGNDTVGTAYAVVTGIGTYDGYAVSVPFTISGVTTYYAVSTGSDANGSSSISGDGSPTGWSITRGGAKTVNGITADNTIYTIWQTRWMRTPPNRNYATPPTSAIVVEPDCTWTIGDKNLTKTLTLSNVVVRAGGKVVVDPIAESDTTLYNNTIGGTFDLARGASILLGAKTTAADNVTKQYILSGAVTGTGAVWMPSMNTGATYSTPLANQITGDLSGFTGDIGTWNGVAAVSLELVNASSIPGDPEPEDVAYVVVTNGATLKVSQDWTSPTNRIWILGDSGTPTINVPSGKTVTINADLIGSAGFNKTGAGTLILKGASPDFSGTVTISGGEIKLAGAAAQLSAAPRITWVENGGTYVVASLTVYPIADQTVYDLVTLAAGVRPSVTVSNLESMVELVRDTDYTVAYANNTAYGKATATVTGVGDYAGTVRDVTFNIHLVKQITADYALSADEDWTAFESIDVASGAVIDLKGHDLTISGLGGAGEITDSIGGGSLIFDVPAVFTSGYTAAITGVSLTGKLKLVKEGAGILVCSKTGQTYTGGNEILGGVLRLAASANMQNSYLGPNASDAYCPIYIGPDGILDPAGSYIWGYHRITIDGGTVSNTVANTSDNWIFNPVINVTDDFTFATTQNYKWMSGGTLNLDGHTVTVWIGEGKWLHLSAAMTNGAMDVVSGGFLKPFSNDVYSPTLDVTLNAAPAMDKAWTIHDYRPTFPRNYGQGSAALNVLGTFTPDTDYYFAPTMQDGSAIDLSAKTGVWSAYSSLTYGGNRTTKFASGATVAILLGSRTPAMDERIVSWTPEVRPASSVSFTNETYVFRYGNYGIYVDSPRTFNPTFLPDIASARLASDVEAAIEASLSVTNLVTDETLALGTDYAYAYTIDHGVCTVTVTGKGDNAGVSVVRKFAILEIGFKATDYTYSMDITPGEGKVTNTLTNFPVLVRLSESIPGFSYDKCKSDELRFALADGTMLAHEIDYWNENGESTVWVNVPELTSNTVIRACWGFKPGREPLDRPSDEAWSDYVGVWHFSEASGIAHDSSGNGYDSIDDGGGTLSNLNAKVGLARNANMTSMITSVTKLDSTSAVKPITTMSKFSVSGWMYSNVDVATASKKYPQQIRNKNGWDEGTGWYTGIEGTSDKFCGNGSGRTRTIITLPASIYTNWVYITTIFNDTSCSVYANGAFVTNTPINTVKASTTYPLRFATDFNGIMDEYRIHDRLEDDAYIAADYATQTDPDFLTFGEVQYGGGFYLIVR